jgi:hypothetical protein
MKAIATSAVCGLVIAAAHIAAAQAPPAPKPGPEHQRLGVFVGTWNVQGEVHASPMGPAGKMSSTDTCEWFEGRFAVLCRSEGRTPMGPAKSVFIMSYSPEEKVYTYYSTDNSGMAMTTVPKGTVKGDTWTYTDTMMAGGQKIALRVTIKEDSPTQQTFRMEMAGPDGKHIPVIDAKQTKVK